MYARLRCGGNLPLCLAFGTGEGLLRYGICVPCSKRLPVVRDAFSEAFGAKNRLLWYATHLQSPAEQPIHRLWTASCPPDAFPEAYRAKSSLLPHRMHLQCAKRPPLSLFAPATPSLAPSTALGTRNAHRSEVIRLKRGCIPWKSLRIHPPPF